MPKLYHHAGSWQLPGQQDKNAARVDVPGQPAELAAWLNARLVPLNATADVLAAGDEPLGEPTEGDFFRLGPPTKNPPRVPPAFLGDLEAGAEFVPVTKAAEIDRLLGRCPACHTSADVARARIHSGGLDAIAEWIERAAPHQLDTLSDLIEELRK